ncbi:MAG TPA: hypothetical protein PLS03_09110, partial [Terrimicrobiaceae bacterium]|nr:hypothetical protein [Terrimicrobiaceae bacterium]
MIVQTKPAALEDPVCGGIFECTFRSERDNTLQTFLIKDYRSQDSPAGSTAVIYLHGSGSHQEQGMTRGIYGGAFERWGEEFARRKVIHVCPE